MKAKNKRRRERRQKAGYAYGKLRAWLAAKSVGLRVPPDINVGVGPFRDSDLE